ncbi:unnamed protein product [Meloidogyne enterolobii]|uniref:Uncharacterized protein n=1 Tax=Meloidogyne enterolobii TaxID=390850 RepID=A0ACB1AU53_MELEN
MPETTTKSINNNFKNSTNFLPFFLPHQGVIFEANHKTKNKNNILMIANDSLKIGRNGYTSLRRKSHNLIIPLSPLPIHRSKSQQNVAELSNGALSFIGEAANQIKRGAKGAGSLGAADSADEQRPITSQLAVPSVSSLKSSSSSAQELSQAKKFFNVIEYRYRQH